MTPTTKPGEADLMELIEQYADARHKHGAPEYNAISSAARNRVIAALGTAPATPVPAGAPGSTDAERAEWLADKIVAGGDYAKEAASMLRRWPTPAVAMPASEPVAWMLEWVHSGEVRAQRLYDDERHCRLDAESDGGVCVPLARALSTPTSPAPAPATQAPTQGEANER